MLLLVTFYAMLVTCAKKVISMPFVEVVAFINQMKGVELFSELVLPELMPGYFVA